MLRNPFYKGESVHRGQGGELVRQVPALVDAATWQAAQDALTRNRRLSKKNAKHDYWLRGLIRCGECGLSYVGGCDGGTRRYRCVRHSGMQVNHRGPCRSKAVRADWIEAAVWEECRAFILNPGDALAQAQRKLRERLSEAAGFEDRRKRLMGDLAGKEAERERVLTLFRRGTISAEEAEAQLDAVAHEAGQIRELLESMRAQAALIEAQEAELTDSAALLTRLHGELEEIDRTDDWTRRRQIIERYVRQIVVHTVADVADVLHPGETERKPRKLSAEVKVYLRLKPEPISIDNSTRKCTCRRG
jgi:site-specific DNA recombinase